MYIITKAYKEGRAVMYYDIVDVMSNNTKEKVHKDTIVKLTEDGQIKDCKIQWWEGKPIVRLADKNIPIIKIQDGQAVEVKRQTPSAVSNKVCAENIANKAVVVGKIPQKRQKEKIAFGYDKAEILEVQQLKSTVKINELDTIEALFNSMAKDFNIKKVAEYREAISRKIKLDRKISNIPQMELYKIQDAMCTYLMNMANAETQEAYMKYRVTYI